jgi:hypothetical protein
MLSSNAMKLSGRGIICALLFAGSLWLSKDSTRAFLMDPQTTNAGQSPTIIIAAQEGAPLQIISTWIESKKPQNFKLVAQVQNQSVKGIRAYAINSQTATSKQQNGSSQFENLTQRSAIWQPTEVRTIEVSDYSLEGQINSVRIIVDFVEFNDGTTWGPDTQNSRDILAGQREAAKSERQRLRQLWQTKGREALISDLQTSDVGRVESLIKNGHSAQWLEGWRSGLSSVHRHLKVAIASGDEERIKAELSKHYDTSEEDCR